MRGVASQRGSCTRGGSGSRRRTRPTRRRMSRLRLRLGRGRWRWRGHDRRRVGLGLSGQRRRGGGGLLLHSARARLAVRDCGRRGCLKVRQRPGRGACPPRRAGTGSGGGVSRRRPAWSGRTGPAARRLGRTCCGARGVHGGAWPERAAGALAIRAQPFDRWRNVTLRLRVKPRLCPS